MSWLGKNNQPEWRWVTQPTGRQMWKDNETRQNTNKMINNRVDGENTTEENEQGKICYLLLGLGKMEFVENENKEG